jgi:hypothetical protein
MIQRVVLVEIRPEYRADLAQIAAHTHQVLSGIDGVRSCAVTTAADRRTERDWQLCILIQLDDLAAADRYRDDDTHRAYADVYLKPMRGAIRVYHFEVAAD